VIKEFAEVVDRSEEFDLGVHAVVSAVVEPTTEALEELDESGLHQGTSLSVLLPAQRCGEAGCHLVLAAARASNAEVEAYPLSASQSRMGCSIPAARRLTCVLFTMGTRAVMSDGLS
jgi:hypothetical protein